MFWEMTLPLDHRWILIARDLSGRKLSSRRRSGAFLFKEILYDIANGAYYLALPISGWVYRLHARSSVYGFRGGFRVESDVFEATSAGKLTAERVRPFGRNERYA